MIKYIYICLLAGLSFTEAVQAQQSGKWGDQGDGTYRNPIIAGDYSDPDVIRVGKDYYMVTSTFQLSPGVHILHSKDLVNWETIGAVFSDVSKLGPNFNWDKMGNYNNGIYAPSIRYHNGNFWVFVNCYFGEGFWMATAEQPTGPWKIFQVKDKNGKPLRTSRWTDPCPFWDDDGKAYLGTSKPGGLWYSYLFQMTPDGQQLLDADVDSMNIRGVLKPYPYSGTVISPVISSEGNKIYKVNGYYYLVHIEFMGKDAGTYILRSKNIYGTKADGTPGKPGDAGFYEKKKMGDEIPGQGGFVSTPEGRWYWIGQCNQMGTDGRSPNLLPVKWVRGWPVPGKYLPNKGAGAMLWQAVKPVPGSAMKLPQSSDEFDAEKLHPQWQWNHQPKMGKWSLTERRGWLRLRAFPAVDKGGFFKAGNTICQRYLKSDTVTLTVKLDITGMAGGQESGLSHFNGGKNYANIGLLRTNSQMQLKYDENGKLGDTIVLPDHQTTIWLRSLVRLDGLNYYSYSLDGKTFIPFGAHYQLKQGNYRGDNIGIYSYNNAGENGYIDVDFFRYEIKHR